MISPKNFPGSVGGARGAVGAAEPEPVAVARVPDPPREPDAVVHIPPAREEAEPVGLLAAARAIPWWAWAGAVVAAGFGVIYLVERAFEDDDEGASADGEVEEEDGDPKSASEEPPEEEEEEEEA